MLLCYLLPGSEEKLSVCRKYGADVAVNYKTSDFAAEVLSATDNQGTAKFLHKGHFLGLNLQYN